MSDYKLKFKTSSEARLEALKYIEGRRTGKIKSYTTPWSKFNQVHLDGIELNKIITIAGMSSSGKSAISNQLEGELYELNPNEDFLILSFNFEMPSQQIALRNLVSKTNISYRDMLSAGGMVLGNKELDIIKKTIQYDNENKREVYYIEYPQTVEMYKAICRKFYELHKKPFITISDHSILFKRSASENTATDTLYSLGDASMLLKKELPITQIHLSQLNREIESTERRVPNSALNYVDKSCLFGGDALFQAVDTVLINHRPYLLNFRPNTYGPNKLPCGPEDIYWHFIKTRDFEPTIAKMIADFKNMKIHDG